MFDDTLVETCARAANLEASKQRGLPSRFEDDWETLTEQERGGWRHIAYAVLEAERDALMKEG